MTAVIAGILSAATVLSLAGELPEGRLRHFFFPEQAGGHSAAGPSVAHAEAGADVHGADAHRVGAVDPMEIPKVAKDAGCDLAMLDTAVKDGHTLFDYLDIDKLKEFVDEAHGYGLLTALAGSVKKDQLKPLHDIGCDVVGIRGAACVGGDRNTGKIHHTAVAELKELCDSF